LRRTKLGEQCLDPAREPPDIRLFLPGQAFDSQLYFRCDAARANFTLENELQRPSAAKVFGALRALLVFGKTPRDVDCNPGVETAVAAFDEVYAVISQPNGA